MKPLLLSAALLFSTPLLHAAQGPLKETALALANSYKDSVLFLSAVVEIEMTAGDSPAKKDERKLEILGTVIGSDGLIVVPLSTLDMASSMDGRTVNTPKGPLKISAKSTTKEVKILMPDGSEVDAKVVAKDPDLDLAFIRPEKPEEVKLTAIDTADSAPLSLLDDVVILGRLGKELSREPVVMTSEVAAIITKPRTFVKVGTQTLGMPVFNKDGKFVGFGVSRFSPKGDSDEGPKASNVVLPAEDLMESAAQAK